MLETFFERVLECEIHWSGPQGTPHPTSPLKGGAAKEGRSLAYSGGRSSCVSPGDALNSQKVKKIGAGVGWGWVLETSQTKQGRKGLGLDRKYHFQRV